MRRFLTMACGAIVAMACQAGAALAQHAGDVSFEYDSGMISIIPGDEGLVFDGDFPTSGLFERFASDPGFISELDQDLGVNPDDIISYNVLDNLFFWSAATQDLASPGATTITVDNAVGANTTIGAATGPLVPGGVIGQADGAGSFHSHVDFELSAGAALGAYGMLWELDTDAAGIGNSAPFWIVFNFGLDAETFEMAADAIVNVPEPTSLMLGAIGACALAVFGWRRTRASRIGG